MREMEVRLSETQEYKDFMDIFFPVRRLMAIGTLSSTSALAGFGDLPSLFDSVKSLTSFVASTAATPNADRERNGSLLHAAAIDQLDFQKQVSDNFPGSPDDPKCLEFPNLTADFWENFFKELARLIKYFPSILFRGLANNLDPAYKEMRSHYLNCDIRQLSWRGVGLASPPTRLVNGLNLNGGGHGERKGKYVPILPVQLPLDYASSIMPFINPYFFGITLAKTASYAFSGFLPFIDPSTMFKVPCLDIDKNWLKGERWDLGFKGRYGHPLSPLTAFALSTLELPADIRKRDSNCQDQIELAATTENECEDVQE
jgi:hypothetical protein